MDVEELRPSVPEWALWAGLPAPYREETFTHYVARMGLDSAPLLAGLNENSLPIANQRLATELMRQLPWFYEGWVQVKRRARGF